MGACCSCCSGPNKYDVSIAGCDKVNGVYVEDGTYGGRPSYSNEKNGMSLWYNEGEWRFGYTRDYYYINKSDDENPPITGWEMPDDYANSDASRPVPNVTKKCCTCCPCC